LRRASISKLVTDHFLKYSLRLKALSIAFLCAFLLGGCADPLEKPMLQDVPAKFQRGFTGNGELGPMNRDDDQTIKNMHP